MSRKIKAEKIKQAVSELAIQANINLRPDVLKALKQAEEKESNARAKKLLKAIIQNAFIAKNEKLAICQDTGLPVVFVELGQDAKVSGNLKQAILKGVESGYKAGYLRKSIVKNPLLRKKPEYQGAIVHIDLVKGNKIKLTVLPKGFGCENKSALKMFNPAVGLEEIKKFIINSVKSAGADACPPYIVGVGIGGTADYAAFLAKKALLRNTRYAQRNTRISKLEFDLVKAINKLNIGPMGLGGKTTCLGVNIKTYPTHIAGLPVAVNISCHALRSASKII